MFAGIMLCLHAEDRGERLQEIYQFGEEHDWMMGEGSVDRVYFTPNFQNTLAELTGNEWSSVPEFWLDPIKDHQRHVVALNFILRGEAAGKAPKDGLVVIEKFFEEEPKNALYSYIVHRYNDGDQTKTIKILNELFPKGRMPESKDWCGSWLWERSSENSNWLPCEERETHTGGELIFLAKLLENAQGKALSVY